MQTHMDLHIFGLGKNVGIMEVHIHINYAYSFVFNTTKSQQIKMITYMVTVMPNIGG